MPQDLPTTDLVATLTALLLERRPRLLGLHGAQGSGKSTLAGRLVASLGDHGMRAVTLSLDDVYLTRAERQRLAHEVHPLLAVRGVPGTHDLHLAHRTLDGLLRASPGEQVEVPVFDKGVDDRVAPRGVSGPVDLVILEGWCVGLPPVEASSLVEPINDLERVHDPDGRWRRGVAAQLAGPYAALWARIDLLVALIPPDLSTVVAWRNEQEAQRRQAGAPRALPDEAAVAAFVAHYERWTRWGMARLPSQADVVVTLDRARGVVRCLVR